MVNTIINGPCFLSMVYRYGMMQEIRMDKKWKILFTIPNFDTAGSGRALFNIINHLDENYFESHISCSHSKGELFKEIIRPLKYI